MAHILVVQNWKSITLGAIAEPLAARGARLTTPIGAVGERLPESDEGFDALIVLGGPMAANDDETYPHLAAAVDLIRRFHARDKPVLGICLGAQLIARSFGTLVHPSSVTEMGFFPLRLTEAAATDPVLKGLEPVQWLFHWHHDTFDLPHGATLLMTGEALRNQAFRLDEGVYGFQCHFEVTAELTGRWLDETRDDLAEHHADFPRRVAVELPRHIAGSLRFCRRVAERWYRLVTARQRRPESR